MRVSDEVQDKVEVPDNVALIVWRADSHLRGRGLHDGPPVDGRIGGWGTKSQAR